ncbi:hypothetical protein V6N11_079553, partial [Hibiscus sabdariffa]
MPFQISPCGPLVIAPLAKAKGVEPRNLRKLVENGIQGVAELKQLYMEKLMKGTDSGKSTKGDSTNGDAEDGKFKRKLLFFLYGCLNIFRLVSGLSWEPMVMWRALRHIKNTNYELQLEVKALDCLDWSEDIVDSEILKDGLKDEVVAVAKLAQRCLNSNRKLRPTMKEVSLELERLKTQQ